MDKKKLLNGEEALINLLLKLTFLIKAIQFMIQDINNFFLMKYLQVKIKMML
jgi:hypothetical protein